MCRLAGASRAEPDAAGISYHGAQTRLSMKNGNSAEKVKKAASKSAPAAIAGHLRAREPVSSSCWLTGLGPRPRGDTRES